MTITNVLVAINTILTNPKVLFNPRINKVELLGEIILGNKETENASEPPDKGKEIKKVIDKVADDFIPGLKFIRECHKKNKEITDENKKPWYQRIYYKFLKKLNYQIDKSTYVRLIKYHINMFFRSIMMSGYKINQIKRELEGESYTKKNFENIFDKWFDDKDIEYYSRLLKYRNDVVIPICIFISVLIIYNNKMLKEYYFHAIIFTFMVLPIYVPYICYTKYQEIKSMLILVDKIMRLNKESKATTDRALYWIFGNYKIVWESSSINPKSIIRKYKEEKNSNEHYYNLSPFQGFLFDCVRIYYEAY